MKDEIIARLDEIVKKSNDMDITKVIEHTKDQLNKEHVLCISIVADIYGKKAVFKLLSDVFNIADNMNELEKYITAKDAYCMQFEYGEAFSVNTSTFNIEGREYPCIKVSLQSEYLLKTTLHFYAGIDYLMLCDDILNNADLLVHLTNATMAIKMNEKKWLNEIVIPRYGDERVHVVLYNIEFINTQRDVQALITNCGNILANFSKNIKLYKSIEDIYSVVKSLPENEVSLKDKRKKTIIMNCISNITAVIERKLELCDVDIERLTDVLHKVETSRNSVELAGRVTVENLISNEYDELRYQLVNSADAYSDQLESKINEKLRKSKKFNDDLANVSTYVEESWVHFSQEAEKLFITENKKIFNQCAEQIEFDCGELLKIIEDGGFENIAQRIKLNISNVMTGEYPDKAEMKKKNRLSIGILAASSLMLLLTAHPILCLSTAIGGGVYLSKRNSKSDDQEQREKMMNEIHNNCYETKKKVIFKINESVDNVRQKTQENATAAYMKAIESLMKSVNETTQDIRNVKSRINMYKDIEDFEIPEIMKMI